MWRKLGDLSLRFAIPHRLKKIASVCFHGQSVIADFFHGKGVVLELEAKMLKARFTLEPSRVMLCSSGSVLPQPHVQMYV